MDSVMDAEIEWREGIIKNEARLLYDNTAGGKDLSLAYTNVEKNAWIIRTLVDKKSRYRLKACKTLVKVGAGMYPYSMFDVHKQYPDIMQIAIEIDPKRALICNKIVAQSPAKGKILVVTMDGKDYDYSNLTQDDLVFISVDVPSTDIISKVINTSKAHIFKCAPYEKTWLVNSIRDSKTYPV